MWKNFFKIDLKIIPSIFCNWSKRFQMIWNHHKYVSRKYRHQKSRSSYALVSDKSSILKTHTAKNWRIFSFKNKGFRGEKNFLKLDLRIIRSIFCNWSKRFQMIWNHHKYLSGKYRHQKSKRSYAILPEKSQITKTQTAKKPTHF